MKKTRVSKIYSLNSVKWKVCLVILLIKQLILNIISVKASRLNDSERKLYAEKVTLAFWRAVGGDNEEIEGLDESEETVN